MAIRSGHRLQTRGELDRAVEMYEKSLAINEALGRQEGMASDYGNLGIVYQTRGELDRAVEMYEKSLAINEALGRQEGMASVYGNLGIVYKRGANWIVLSRCMKNHWRKALGRQEGMATVRQSGQRLPNAGRTGRDV